MMGNLVLNGLVFRDFKNSPSKYYHSTLRILELFSRNAKIQFCVLYLFLTYIKLRIKHIKIVHLLACLP